MSKGQENPWTSAPLIHNGAVAHVRTTVIVLLEYSGIYKLYYTMHTTVLMCNHAWLIRIHYHIFFLAKLFAWLRYKLAFVCFFKNSLFASHIEQMQATIRLFPLMISSYQLDIVFLTNGGYTVIVVFFVFPMIMKCYTMTHCGRYHKLCKV